MGLWVKIIDIEQKTFEKKFQKRQVCLVNLGILQTHLESSKNMQNFKKSSARYQSFLLKSLFLLVSTTKIVTQAVTLISGIEHCYGEEYTMISWNMQFNLVKWSCISIILAGHE